MKERHDENHEDVAGRVQDPRAAMEAALKDVAARYGVTVRYRGGRFTDTMAALKAEFVVEGAEPQGAADFRRLADVFGLKPEDLGRTFRSGGQTFTVVGLAPRKSKYPILATNAAGKTYKFTADGVAAYLRRGEAP